MLALETPMLADRLLSILMLLQLRERLTAETLAAEFEVSVRTIYRDIDKLAAAGVPVYADRGPGGGFQLVDGYRTRLTGLAADEAEALLMAGLPGPAAALGLGAAATRASRKLLVALPPGSGESAGRIATRFHLDTVDWYRADETLPQLPALARAVFDQHLLQMTYESWTGIRDWVVEPLGLVLKAGAWYLVAHGHGKRRIFKVANIRAHVVCNERFERPADFDLAAWWTEETARFEAGLRPGIAELRLTPLGLKRLSQSGAYAQQAAATAQFDTDGIARVNLPIEHIEQAALLLLGIGPEVEVIAPFELRERLRALALEVMERYG
jgi:predicted DNA-binding transcriptional regulator YafY